jgi:hypothetical protein
VIATSPEPLYENQKIFYIFASDSKFSINLKLKP